MTTYFIEYFADDPVPHSFHVEMDGHEADEVETFISDRYEDPDSVVTPVITMPLTEFLEIQGAVWHDGKLVSEDEL